MPGLSSRGMNGFSCGVLSSGARRTSLCHPIKMVFSNRDSCVNSILFVAFTAPAWTMVLSVIGTLDRHIMAFVRLGWVNV